ncbi:formyl peptide receptor-related sequence 6-like [Littorina saxatilis]|uniref:G-protein coupled receptors family 1 profile domain-containing protein n=1 Tax=Littorina saxatilis TaxID=31220 RepID=A0AAN9BPP2_9CAEN
MATFDVSDVADITTHNTSVSDVTSTLTSSSNGSFSNVTITSSAGFECPALSLEGLEFIPWDNPDNIVSAQVEEITSRVANAVILPLLFLIGGPGNVINMAVFYKQGLRERVNLCLFALSLADWLYLVQAMLVYGEQMYLWLSNMGRYGPMAFFMGNNALVGLFGFTWVSQIMSAIIASERCLCVMSPLRSQTILKTKTMAIIIGFVFAVVVGLYFIVGARYAVVCVYDLALGRTTFMLVASEFYLNHETLVNYTNTFIYGAGIPVVVIVVVTVTTTITARKIRQAARWRAQSSASDAVKTLSPRDVALTKMLIGTSLLFMVCVFPIALFRCVWLFLPEVNPGRRQHNLFLTSIWIVDALSFVNSTFNIFIYYTMGSRYRETFWALFRKQTTDKKKQVFSTTGVTKK